MNLTTELLETLTQQFQARRIPETEIRAVALAALEIWLAKPAADRPFSESAVPFTRRLIAQNRELFEKLAQR